MEKIKQLKRFLRKYKVGGYIIPKNDEFFGEYVPEHNDRLNYISNFSGSFGFALILKNKNYLFVDGRYTLQANYQSGKFFKVITVPKHMPKDILKSKRINIGYDPKIITRKNLNVFFRKNNCKFQPIKENLLIKFGKGEKKE